MCPVKEPLSLMTLRTAVGNDSVRTSFPTATRTRTRPKDPHSTPRCADNSIDACIEALIASAPPLTCEQRDKLALLLRKPVARDTAPPVPNPQAAKPSIPPAA